jgi:hypothetical protein
MKSYIIKVIPKISLSRSWKSYILVLKLSIPGILQTKWFNIIKFNNKQCILQKKLTLTNSFDLDKSLSGHSIHITIEVQTVAEM